MKSEAFEFSNHWQRVQHSPTEPTDWMREFSSSLSKLEWIGCMPILCITRSWTDTFTKQGQGCLTRKRNDAKTFKRDRFSLAKHVWDAHGCTTSHQMSITSDSSSNLLRAQQSQVPSANKAVMRVSHDEPTSIMISVTCSLDKNLDHLWHLVSPMWGSVIVAFSKTTGTRQHAIPLTHPRNTSARKGGHCGRQVATLGRLLRLIVFIVHQISWRFDEKMDKLVNIGTSTMNCDELHDDLTFWPSTGARFCPSTVTPSST